ncbi:3-dehydroquinate synthase [Tunicatimonas pelagia]|uniref:3-dehydroquinate synthase n=1 Tax=Tunicatimonas pelagia TaxID=931531 RepID=UPI002664EBC4|nr:3-dehydroquinate synthase [Tunicatimonas pelagia]WKN45236.1 3-dehydroquinate synthase [Tunicatimonas pelagia]
MPANSVTITDNITGVLSDVLRRQKPSQVAVLVDENIREHCLPLIQEVLSTDCLIIEIKSGEVYKNLDTCAYIWQQLTEEHFDRKGLLINLGGGVIGDMGGFCAATYKRGMSFVNIPTTLLAQVDASVGGKLGVDFNGFKNHIGLFQEPQQVLIDANFLKTLPEQELRSGFAEVIKHALIQDGTYWNKLRGVALANQPWVEHIRHSVQVKSWVVERDFREGGLRKILNFGHTVGHAVESHFLESATPLLHGEAIAIGMIAEAQLSVKYASLSLEEAEEIEDFILAIFGKVDIPLESLEAITHLTKQDKKNQQGAILCTLLDKIGKAHFDVAVTESAIREALEYYRGL